MELTLFLLFAILAFGWWNFTRNVSKAADKLSPETKAKAKEIGLGLLSKWLK